MTLLERAIAIALESHKGQTDKAGKAYILHPLRLMLKMKADEEMIVAVLHDVVEDSDVTFEDLKDQGFSQAILDALACVTKVKGECYDDFIRRIKKNPLASRVKVADLQDNMDLGRIPHPQQKDFERVEKYKKALKVLQN
jgi:(p)ppGpp synthase/HD superfamily hydrolase